VPAQLDKVKGVEKSYANRSGKLFRVTVSPLEDVDRVAKELGEVLSTRTRSPTRVIGQELQRALQTEEWRDAERIIELSAIEHRTLTIRTITAFAEEERLNDAQIGRLVKCAEEEWDHLANEISTELRKVRTKRNWQPIYDRFDAALRKRTKPILADEQMDRLMKSLQSKL